MRRTIKSIKFICTRESKALYTCYCSSRMKSLSCNIVFISVDHFISVLSVESHTTEASSLLMHNYSKITSDKNRAQGTEAPDIPLLNYMTTVRFDIATPNSLDQQLITTDLNSIGEYDTNENLTTLSPYETNSTIQFNSTIDNSPGFDITFPHSLKVDIENKSSTNLFHFQFTSTMIPNTNDKDERFTTSKYEKKNKSQTNLYEYTSTEYYQIEDVSLDTLLTGFDQTTSITDTNEAIPIKNLGQNSSKPEISSTSSQETPSNNDLYDIDKTSQSSLSLVTSSTIDRNVIDYNDNGELNKSSIFYSTQSLGEFDSAGVTENFVNTAKESINSDISDNVTQENNIIVTENPLSNIASLTEQDHYEFSTPLSHQIYFPNYTNETIINDSINISIPSKENIPYFSAENTTNIPLLNSEFSSTSKFVNFPIHFPNDKATSIETSRMNVSDGAKTTVTHESSFTSPTKRPTVFKEVTDKQLNLFHTTSNDTEVTETFITESTFRDIYSTGVSLAMNSTEMAVKFTHDDFNFVTESTDHQVNRFQDNGVTLSMQYPFTEDNNRYSTQPSHTTEQIDHPATNIINIYNIIDEISTITDQEHVKSDTNVSNSQHQITTRPTHSHGKPIHFLNDRPIVSSTDEDQHSEITTQFINATTSRTDIFTDSEIYTGSSDRYSDNITSTVKPNIYLDNESLTTKPDIILENEQSIMKLNSDVNEKTSTDKLEITTGAPHEYSQSSKTTTKTQYLGEKVVDNSIVTEYETTTKSGVEKLVGFTPNVLNSKTTIFMQTTFEKLNDNERDLHPTEETINLHTTENSKIFVTESIVEIPSTLVEESTKEDFESPVTKSIDVYSNEIPSTVHLTVNIGTNYNAEKEISSATGSVTEGYLSTELYDNKVQPNYFENTSKNSYKPIVFPTDQSLPFQTITDTPRVTVSGLFSAMTSALNSTEDYTFSNATNSITSVDASVTTQESYFISTVDLILPTIDIENTSKGAMPIDTSLGHDEYMGDKSTTLSQYPIKELTYDISTDKNYVDKSTEQYKLNDSNSATNMPGYQVINTKDSTQYPSTNDNNDDNITVKYKTTILNSENTTLLPTTFEDHISKQNNLHHTEQTTTEHLNIIVTESDLERVLSTQDPDSPYNVETTSKSSYKPIVFPTDQLTTFQPVFDNQKVTMSGVVSITTFGLNTSQDYEYSEVTDSINFVNISETTQEYDIKSTAYFEEPIIDIGITSEKGMPIKTSSEHEEYVDENSSTLPLNPIKELTYETSTEKYYMRESTEQYKSNNSNSGTDVPDHQVINLNDFTEYPFTRDNNDHTSQPNAYTTHSNVHLDTDNINKHTVYENMSTTTSIYRESVTDSFNPIVSERPHVLVSTGPIQPPNKPIQFVTNPPLISNTDREQHSGITSKYIDTTYPITDTYKKSDIYTVTSERYSDNITFSAKPIIYRENETFTTKTELIPEMDISTVKIISEFNKEISTDKYTVSTGKLNEYFQNNIATTNAIDIDEKNVNNSFVIEYETTIPEILNYENTTLLPTTFENLISKENDLHHIEGTPDPYTTEHSKMIVTESDLERVSPPEEKFTLDYVETTIRNSYKPIIFPTDQSIPFQPMFENEKVTISGVVSTTTSGLSTSEDYVLSAVTNSIISVNTISDTTQESDFKSTTDFSESIININITSDRANPIETSSENEEYVGDNSTALHQNQTKELPFDPLMEVMYINESTIQHKTNESIIVTDSFEHQAISFHGNNTTASSQTPPPKVHFDYSSHTDPYSTVFIGPTTENSDIHIISDNISFITEIYREPVTDSVETNVSESPQLQATMRPSHSPAKPTELINDYPMIFNTDGDNYSEASFNYINTTSPSAEIPSDSEILPGLTYTYSNKSGYTPEIETQSKNEIFTSTERYSSVNTVTEDPMLFTSKYIQTDISTFLPTVTEPIINSDFIHEGKTPHYTTYISEGYETDSIQKVSTSEPFFIKPVTEFDATDHSAENQIDGAKNNEIESYSEGINVTESISPENDNFGNTITTPSTNSMITSSEITDVSVLKNTATSDKLGSDDMYTSEYNPYSTNLEEFSVTETLMINTVSKANDFIPEEENKPVTDSSAMFVTEKPLFNVTSNSSNSSGKPIYFITEQPFTTNKIVDNEYNSSFGANESLASFGKDDQGTLNSIYTDHQTTIYSVLITKMDSSQEENVNMKTIPEYITSNIPEIGETTVPTVKFEPKDNYEHDMTFVTTDNILVNIDDNFSSSHSIVKLDKTTDQSIRKTIGISYGTTTETDFTFERTTVNVDTATESHNFDANINHRPLVPALISLVFPNISITTLNDNLSCEKDVQCQTTSMCLASICHNSCSVSKCGIRASCIVLDHRPMCQCSPGYWGNPLTECTKALGIIVFPYLRFQTTLTIFVRYYIFPSIFFCLTM